MTLTSSSFYVTRVGKYGENLAFSIGYPDVITTGVNGWNNERSDYDYNNPTYSHWTQVVSLFP